MAPTCRVGPRSVAEQAGERLDVTCEAAKKRLVRERITSAVGGELVMRRDMELRAEGAR